MDEPRPLSIGLEVEAYTDHVDDQIKMHIRDIIERTSGRPANVQWDTTSRPVETDDQSWKVGDDESIRPKLQGVEIKSPVFVDKGSPTAGGEKEWQSELKRVLKSVMTDIPLATNETTGLHVHVGVKVHTGEKFTLSELKRIAGVVLLYERDVDRLHPPHRSSDENFLRSNRDSQVFKYKNDSEMIEEILEARSVPQLQLLVNPHPEAITRGKKKLPSGTSRLYKVSFMSLGKYGTVEFRQHAGTVVGDEICAWGDLVLAYVRKALSLSEDELRRLDPDVDTLVPDILSRKVAGKVEESLSK